MDVYIAKSRWVQHVSMMRIDTHVNEQQHDYVNIENMCTNNEGKHVCQFSSDIQWSIKNTNITYNNN